MTKNAESPPSPRGWVYVTKLQLTLLVAAVSLAYCIISLLLEINRRPWTVRKYENNSNRLEATSTASTHVPQFTVPFDADVGANLIPNIVDPEAIDSQDVCPGYKASHVRKSDYGLTADLNLAGEACNVYGNDVTALSLVVEYQAQKRLHVEILPRYIDPKNSTWFILPEELVSKPIFSGTHSNESDLLFEWDNDPTFSFSIVRKDNGDVIFSTNGSKLVFEDQFLEFVVPLPEKYNLYGLGEVIHSFRLGNNLTRTLYATDISTPIDGNIYGTHPIYLDTRYFVNGEYVGSATDPSLEYDSFTHGVFLRNAHGQEVLLRQTGITWRALGGSIDLYFYAGPTAAEVIAEYQQSTVGLPAMQQYWTFGYHQCRWGYKGWDNLRDVVNEFSRSKIPLETIWADIDYMNHYRNFEVDPNGWDYSAASEFLSFLHDRGQHFVPIVDSAIYIPNPDNASDAYPTFERGLDADAFILNPDGSLYIGTVWPGYTVFPDWVGALLNVSRTFEWWTNELTMWYEKMPFSGIWIDMSEASSFCVGSCGTGNLSHNPVHPPFHYPGEEESGHAVRDDRHLLLEKLEFEEKEPDGNDSFASLYVNSHGGDSPSMVAASQPAEPEPQYVRTTPTPGIRNVNYPPYVMNHVLGDLAVHAVSPNGTHHGDTKEYDFHNLFGHLELRATYQALTSPGISPSRRPFIIGRSTFAGSGRWAGHWGGDNRSQWSMLAMSIPQALSFSLFGIPMFGVDACGFEGDVGVELCARWMQLAAFLPFYRNHNILGAAPQEPYRWTEVAKATRGAAQVRYAMLPYLYTTFSRAHERGDAVVRALAWEFPQEPWLKAADRQFMLGDAVLVSPVLTSGATTVGAVFPGSERGTVWYDWYSGTRVEGVKRGENITLDAPLDHIPVHLRGGKVVPVQGTQGCMTTTECRALPWELVVALDERGMATGELYVDDGESLEPADILFVEFTAAELTMRVSLEGDFPDKNTLANVLILGVEAVVVEVTFDGVMVKNKNWNWSEKTKILRIWGLEEFTRAGAWVTSWEIRWG